MTELTFSGATEEICESAFHYCKALETINFSDSLKIIGRFAFYHQRALALSAGDWAENANAYLPYIESFLSLLYLALRQAEKIFPEPRRPKER